VLLYRDENRYEEVQAVANSINALFESLGNEVRSDRAKIVLKDCVPVSESELTLSAARKLQKWEKDHMSLRSDPPGEMLGEL